MWREWASPATAWRSRTLLSRVPFGVPPEKPETSRFQAFFLLFNGIWNCRILALEQFRNRNIHWNTLDHIVQTLISCRNGRFFMSSAADSTCPFPNIPSSFSHGRDWSNSCNVFAFFKSVTIFPGSHQPCSRKRIVTQQFFCSQKQPRMDFLNGYA